MKRIFIDAGHGGADPGAIGSGFREADLTKEARNGIVANLKAMGYTGEIIVDKDDNTLAETIKYFNSFKPVKEDILISLHFNAGGEGAKGTEVIHRANASDGVKTFCKNLAAIVVSEPKWKLRGDAGAVNEADTPHKKLGILHLVPTAGLIEFCFVSNRDEILQYSAIKNTIWNNLAKYLFKLGQA